MSNHRLRNKRKLDLVKGRFNLCLTIFSWPAIRKKEDLCATDSSDLEYIHVRQIRIDLTHKSNTATRTFDRVFA